MSTNLTRIAVGAAAGIAVASCVSAAAITIGTVAALRQYQRSRRERNLRGEIALITGGSRGLGLALARELLDAGCRVAICARDEEELAKASRQLGGIDAGVFTVVCDVSNRDAVRDMVQKVQGWAGRIDILVTNAGEISVSPLEHLEIEDFERAMAVMFWGTIHPTLEVLEGMKTRRHGRIAHITSIGGKVAIPHLLPYCCAKFAAVGFSEGLRPEVARHGVKVTTIAPGLMRTGSHLQARFKGNQPAESAWFSLAATMPGISMSAERAAKQIVTALERGRSEKILSPQANLLALLQSISPGAVSSLLSLATRLAPEAGADGASEKTGAELVPEKGNWFQIFTTLGQRAAERLNQFGSASAAAGGASH